MFNIFLLLPFFGAIKSESYPPKLSEEEEKYYLTLLKNKDKNARAKLIEHNLRLVAHIAKKYENTKEDKDDILSIGILGLIKAVDSFNFDSENKLATYAARCIENEILMSIRANKNKRNYVYLESPIGFDKEGNQIELMDLIKDDKPEMLDTMLEEWQVKNLYQALNSLSERELDIINRRYGINMSKCQTQKEIAKEMKISRSYVSRIEKRALMKLYLVLNEDSKSKGAF